MVAFKPVKRRLWRRLAFGIGLLCLFALSSVTPIFSSVIGGVLTLIGDYYGAPASPSTPNAYIILGGGLTRLEGHITLNAYSEQRLKTLAMRWQMTPLPVVLSGVESPWLNERWYALHKYNPDKAKPLQLFADNASMNTCENARFATSLSLTKVPLARYQPLTTFIWCRIGTIWHALDASLPAWDLPPPPLSHQCPRRVLGEIYTVI